MVICYEEQNTVCFHNLLNRSFVSRLGLRRRILWGYFLQIHLNPENIVKNGSTQPPSPLYGIGTDSCGIRYIVITNKLKYIFVYNVQLTNGKDAVHSTAFGNIHINVETVEKLSFQKLLFIIQKIRIYTSYRDRNFLFIN